MKKKSPNVVHPDILPNNIITQESTSKPAARKERSSLSRQKGFQVFPYGVLPANRAVSPPF